MHDAIVIEALSKRYRGVNALDSASLTVPRGSLYGLLGPNGAGKTTLLDLLLNLQEPTGGRATVLGKDSRRLSGRDFERIGYISESQHRPGDMRVGYFLGYIRAFYPNWDDERAEVLIQQYGLPLSRRIRHLSRGMWMKTALASSLACHPELLVLDEPFSGLDVRTRDELIQTLLECAHETTVLLSTHDHAEIESFATHIGYLNEGQLEFSEKMAAFTERVREVVVTLERAFMPDPWPVHWLSREMSPSITRFIDTQFDEERTLRDVYRRFEGVRGVETHALPLRDILLALSGRGPAPSLGNAA